VILATWNRWRKNLKLDKKAEIKHTEEMDELWTREFKLSDRRCVQCWLTHIFCVLSGDLSATSKIQIDWQEGVEDLKPFTTDELW
jgi:hypothetical protein